MNDSRNRIVEDLRKELLGPSEPEEELKINPSSRYLLGILSPAGTKIGEADDEQEIAQGDEAGETHNLTQTFRPSSIGLSVVIGDEELKISAEVTWGEYKEYENINTDEAKGGRIWKRTSKKFDFIIDTDVLQDTHEERGVRISYQIRNIQPTANQLLTVYVMNCNDEPPINERPHPSDLLYQPCITLSSEDPVFKPVSAQTSTDSINPDIESANLIYRNIHKFGAGHNTAVDWEYSGDSASRVWTDLLPTVEVPIAKAIDASISMDDLATKPRSEVQKSLRALLSGYETWITQRESEIPSISNESLRQVARSHMDKALASLDRMLEGTACLDDPDVFLAFQFANRAMALQRRHSEVARRVQEGLQRYQSIKTSEIQASWRLFQIGFILQTLPSIIDPFHKDRQTADLLWFPTGGGKTEAYLGLTAFIFAYRRLRSVSDGESNSGVAVIMRYTLRLLTIQQFQRALTLTMACEFLRAEARKHGNSPWGDERFSLGLWVGNAVTPNSYEDAKKSLGSLKSGARFFGSGSPYQIVFCPWCGEDFDPAKNYESDDKTRKIHVKCKNRLCSFRQMTGASGIPAELVDEQLYANPPSLLISTVDKFAQMAWNGKIQSLFGRVAGHCTEHGWFTTSDTSIHPETRKSHKNPEAVIDRTITRLAPADLIIQDELHLISGPLGTLVGLYETVVDSLYSQTHGKGKRVPKIIASTATVANAERQVENLFDRDVSVFPALGTDFRDSYFSRVEDTGSPTSHSRLYVGVFGPGASKKTILIRTYAALLSRAKHEFEKLGLDPKSSKDLLEIAETYMTLVGYFNSLHELGGMIRLLEDDIVGRLHLLHKNNSWPQRNIFERPELTSRRTSSELSETLKRLSYPHKLKSEQKEGKRYAKGKFPIDVLLTSNIIQVGVDIDRLGLMVMAGQPKTTAEYIQATSRVGRKHPGLVVNVYNWLRPRDISHFEDFRHYHEAFYRQVEPTSVTPFSERALDRALEGILASFVRMSNSKYGPPIGANNFLKNDTSIQGFVDSLLDRVRRATNDEEKVQELKESIDSRLDYWENLAETSAEDLLYSSRGQSFRKSKFSVLFEEFGSTSLPEDTPQSSSHTWQVPTSLRDVEIAVPVSLHESEQTGG